MDEAIGESSLLRRRSGELKITVEALFAALSAWRGVANHLDTAASVSRTGGMRSARASGLECGTGGLVE
jgi:hypothetical protein